MLGKESMSNLSSEANRELTTKPHLVGQDDTFGQGRSQCEQRRIDLVRVHVHLGRRQGLGERLFADAGQGQAMREEGALGGGDNRGHAPFLSP